MFSAISAVMPWPFGGTEENVTLLKNYDLMPDGSWGNERLVKVVTFENSMAYIPVDGEGNPIRNG